MLQPDDNVGLLILANGLSCLGLACPRGKDGPKREKKKKIDTDIVDTLLAEYHRSLKPTRGNTFSDPGPFRAMPMDTKTPEQRSEQAKKQVSVLTISFRSFASKTGI